MPLCLQLMPQDGMVLDDSVVNDGNAATAVKVGMCVVIRGRSVRCPTGVTNPDARCERRNIEAGLEILHLSSSAEAKQSTVLDQRDSGRVIAAILKALEALEKDRSCTLPSDITDNPTHPNHPRSACGWSVARRRRRSNGARFVRPGGNCIIGRGGRGEGARACAKL